jgi:hypothetical protein
MVQIRHGREESFSAALTITNDDAAFTASLDFEHLDDRTCSLKDITHDTRVDLESMFGGLLEECLISYLMDISFLSRSGFRSGELTLGHKVASERRRMGLVRGHSSAGTVGFNTIRLGRS